jgi:hypothetical protein
MMSSQAFVIPSGVETVPSHAGWSIWTFTDLDWHLLRGLPAHAWLRRYRFTADTEEAESLLAECADCEWAMGKVA